MANVCVIGGGPAGSTYAARMAQLGHDVCLIEAASFPRPRLGESLSPGVLPLLETTGARARVESAGFQRVRRVHVHWEGAAQVREDPREEGLLVDRGEFDRLLLQLVRELGVLVRQPVRVLQVERDGARWNLDIEAGGLRERIFADFVADASGRAAVTKPRRQQTGCRTIALHAYWHGRELAREPRIEAGADLWSWGVPLPDGSYNALVFVDVNHFRTTRRTSLKAHYLSLIAATGLMERLKGAHVHGPVRASDATPWLDPESVTPSRIRMGDAALSIDPISSSGVQKAIQSALSAAIVSNTMLRKPELADAAMRFYQSSLREASVRHCKWAEEHYGKLIAERASSFWSDRAAGAEQVALAAPIPADPQTLASARVVVSPQLEFVDLPCLDGDFVAIKPALRHPNLESPVAWVGRFAVAPLLQRIERPSTVLQLASEWSSQVPLSSGIALASWLYSRGILVEESQVQVRLM